MTFEQQLVNDLWQKSKRVYTPISGLMSLELWLHYLQWCRSTELFSGRNS